MPACPERALSTQLCKVLFPCAGVSRSSPIPNDRKLITIGATDWPPLSFYFAASTYGLFNPQSKSWEVIG
jgi:hypothetical protein